MTVHEGPIEWPDLEQYSDTPMFNTKAVVQQTGIAAPTLRAWERRYDLLSPERGDNDYRLYSERDIVLINWLKERTDAGMAISQAIALFHHLCEEHEQLASLAPTQQLPTASTTDPPVFQATISQPPVELLPQEQEPAQEKQESSVRNWPQFGTSYLQNIYPATHNMQVVREHLIDAFRHLDEQTATMMMGSMLAIYPVEQICSDLITPTLWQIGQLWAEGQITVSIEHFASNFFRALLTNLFHVTPGPRVGALAIVCCAPGEPHEIAALMLALFLRRHDTRVAYLGQSIEITGLIHTIRKLTPALVCISLTMPAYLPDLVNLSKQVQKMSPPRPIFAFGGQVFGHYAHFIPQIAGIYLHEDLKASVERLHHMLLERTENKN